MYFKQNKIANGIFFCLRACENNCKDDTMNISRQATLNSSTLPIPVCKSVKPSSRFLLKSCRVIKYLKIERHKETLVGSNGPQH